MSTASKLLPLLAASLLLPACTISFGDNYSAKTEREFSFALDGATRLKVETRNGSIHVIHGAGSVECNAKMNATGSSLEEATELLRSAELVADREGNTLYVHLDAPVNLRKISASLYLQVPPEMELDLHSSNGPITVEDAFTDVGAQTSNGSINILSSGGIASLTTSNGPVKLEGNPASFDIRTSNGRIRIALDGNWSGKGSAVSSNGPITLKSSGALTCDVNASTSNGKVLDLRQGSGTRIVQPGHISLRTSNGGIRIEDRTPQ